MSLDWPPVRARHFGGPKVPRVEPAPTPPPPPPPPKAEDPAAKAAADAAAAAEKTVNKKRRGKQSLVLSQPSTGAPIGASGTTRTSILGGGQYPA